MEQPSASWTMSAIMSTMTFIATMTAMVEFKIAAAVALLIIIALIFWAIGKEGK